MKTFNNFLVILVALLSLIGCRDGDNRILESSSSTKLVDIRISPEPLTVKGSEDLILHKNLTQPFVAVGIYSDGTVKNLTDSVSWSTDVETEEPLIEKGFFTPTQSGDVVIKAEFEGHISNQVKITVTDLDPEANSFKVTPNKVTIAKGQPVQLNATLSYSDGTFANIDSKVSYSSDSSLIDINDMGIVTGIDAGNAKVNASYNYDGQVEFQQDVDITVSENYLSEIQLTPGSINIVRDQPFDKLTARGIISDETGKEVGVIDLTERVEWSTNASSVVSFERPGLIIGARRGLAEIYAELNGLAASNIVSVFVDEARLDSISISPNYSTIINGTKADFKVTARYTNDTYSVLTDMNFPVVYLHSSNDSVAFLNSGKILANEPGSSEISDSLQRPNRDSSYRCARG
ncbi:Ig-like domain-containing protein [Vibrio mediterranei]|uniref:Ig-like domain-containing protein n=1 Tax=Vibrio mediterranei TaxID=689 RepID=UPI0038CE0370